MDTVLKKNSSGYNTGKLRQKKFRQFFVSVYELYRFIVAFFKEVFAGPYEFREVVRQCYEIGCKSLPIITLTAFITGIVFTKQSRPSLSEFGATSWLPSLIAIAIIRALAPLITSLVIAGKVGSNMGAELASMRVTEQIDAMEVSSTNPFKFLVITRVVSITVTLPVLVTYFAGIGMLGSYLNVHHNELTSFTAFMSDAFVRISWIDLFSSGIRSIIYGFTIGIILYGGTIEAGPVKEGDFLQSSKPGASTEDMLATLQQNNNNLLSITGNLKMVTGKIAGGEGFVGGLVNDPSLIKELHTTLKNLAAASQISDQAVANIEAITGRLNNQNGLVNELFTDTTLFIQLTGTISDLRQTMAQLKSTTSTAAAFIDKLQAATSDLDNKDKPAGMLLHDEEMAKELKITIKNLNSGSHKLDEDLEALQHNFLLKGYFKKKEKNK